MGHEHDLHVMPHDVGWWIVTTVQGEPLAITRTRDEAVALAKRMQHEDPDYGDILIHGRDGEIRERIVINRSDFLPPRG